MNFTNFSGSSRKARNVNLSGQKPTNPFASSAGPSQSVAHAQAERQQRQHERDRVKAVLRIQRVYRGYGVRRQLRDARREQFDEICRLGRPSSAVALLVAIFQASRADDLARLIAVAQDLLETNYDALRKTKPPAVRVEKLIRCVVEALDRCNETNGHDIILLRVVNDISSLHPEALRDCGLLYEVLRKLCCRKEGHIAPQVLALIRHAVLLPLDVAWRLDTSNAYSAFTSAFLAHPDVTVFERNIEDFASAIDITRLSDAVIQFAGKQREAGDKTSRLWLLAHFIALKRPGHSTTPPTTAYLRALYVQLSSISNVLRNAFAVPDSNGDGDSAPASLPPYVQTELGSLVQKDGITSLLERFSGNAILLSGYMLTLMNCFPSHGDEIRMRLYLADVSIVRSFWETAKKTRVFSNISSGKEGGTLEVIRRSRESRQEPLQLGAPTPRDEPSWGEEWQGVLLFLELFTFVLRLTDDDELFTRGLSAEDLKVLTLFLKQLGFNLYYFASGIQRYDAQGATFSITAGIDFHAFRSIVTTAMRLLYEKDSRRKFLPEGHWLMTSSLDMEGFLQAVFLEEERQKEMGESMGSDDEDEDAGQDRDASHGLEKRGEQRWKAFQDRLRAAYAPKLEVLRNIPYVIPFETRVQIFRQFVHLDKVRRRDGHVDPDHWRSWMVSQSLASLRGLTNRQEVLGRHQAQIRRHAVVSDAMESFFQLEEGLKEPIQITFLDEWGVAEPGIDGGGVTKEFLMSVIKETFSQKAWELFTTTKNHTYYPNPCSMDRMKEMLRATGSDENSSEWKDGLSQLLRRYEFIGRMVGKCLYEGVLIDVVFAGFFLLKWSSWGVDWTNRANINDLHELDDELYQGMLRLKNYKGDMGELDLDFTIVDQVSKADEEPVRTVTRNLCPGGDKMTVTNENKLLYINYVARHKLIVQSFAQTRAFLRGLGLIISPAWLSMFNQSELQRLVGGDNSDIDVEDLRRNTQYSGVYQIGNDGLEHPTILRFWAVMDGLNGSQRRDVLRFVTSTPRGPLLGFAQLQPPFTIRDGGSDQNRLPSASTCVNLLKLPNYKNAGVLREKLLYAAQSQSGFGLS